MRRGHREQLSAAASSSSSRHEDPEPDLFRMLLPNANAHIPKGKAMMWVRHFQQESPCKQRLPSRTPTRPQTSHGPNHVSSAPHASPDLLTSPVKTPATQRCQSAGPCSTPRRFRVPDTPRARFICAKADPQREIDAVDDAPTSGNSPKTAPSQFPLNTEAREHLEMKACMLAHMHRIDVDSIHQLREVANQELDIIKTKQLVARGGILDDGSLVATTKRKTTFLLRHFFALGEPSSSTASIQQETVLYDVVDEWSCRDNASAADIGALWKSIIAHIERSYVLRRHLVPTSEPNPLSVTIAMDCLRKLPAKLPDYQRLLDVIISLVETGLYLPTDQAIEEQGAGDGSKAPSTSQTTTGRRRYFFEEYHAVRDALTRELKEKRARLAVEALDDAARAQTPRQQLESLLAALRSQPPSENAVPSEMEALFSAFFRADIARLTPVALRDALGVCFACDHPNGDRRKLFFDVWMSFLQEDDAEEVLVQLVRHHVGAFQAFFREEFEAMDKLLMEPLPEVLPTPNNARRSSNITAFSPDGTRHNSQTKRAAPTSSESPATTLFHELIERHPTQFAAALWSSPYLTAHVFQDSQHLIARILEQNIVSVSHVLQQRPDVLTALLNHTLKDNSIVIEEFLHSHPKAFSDLLQNKGPAVSSAIKNYPIILADMLQASRSTLAKVLLSMPELLCHLFKSTPELLAQTIREDSTLLPLAFSVVPQCLSDALERHPEYFVDVAHRKPALVAKLFAKYPDLLLDPLEANPSVFSNFLVYHRKILPDFSSPSFDPSFFQFERKQFVDCGQQTEKRLCKYDGKLRVREKIKFQEEAQVYEIRQTLATMTATISTNGRATPAGGNGRTTPSFGNERPTIKETKATNAGLLPPSPGQVMNEIARLYIKKIGDDAQMDTIGKKRRILVDFVLDLYIKELGFKSKAQKKLTLLLTGAQQAEKESLRVKWFLRFMNAGAVSSTPTTSDRADVSWTYHPLASEFYQAAMQFLVSVPVDELLKRLEEELSRPCLVGYTRVKQFIEEPLMARIVPVKDQRQQLLAAICEKEQRIHGASSDGTMVAKTSSATSVTTLHVEDALESLMLEWIQYQDRVRGDWTMQFQLTNPDGSGVVRFNNFATLIRAKLPSMDDRAILKVFHQCGEENDLGEYSIAVDDFSLAMSIIQERDSLRDYVARVTSKPSSFS